MFHLTPQEKSALAWGLTVCLLGASIYYALNINAGPLRWVNAASHKFKPQPPDINTATIEQLDKLPGIGPKTARNIVEYRAQHGLFVSIYDLRKVRGISKKNFEKLRQYYQPEVGHE